MDYNFSYSANNTVKLNLFWVSAIDRGVSKIFSREEGGGIFKKFRIFC